MSDHEAAIHSFILQIIIALSLSHPVLPTNVSLRRGCPSIAFDRTRVLPLQTDDASLVVQHIAVVSLQLPPRQAWHVDTKSRHSLRMCLLTQVALQLSPRDVIKLSSLIRPSDPIIAHCTGEPCVY